MLGVSRERAQSQGCDNSRIPTSPSVGEEALSLMGPVPSTSLDRIKEMTVVLNPIARLMKTVRAVCSGG